MGRESLCDQPVCACVCADGTDCAQRDDDLTTGLSRDLSDERGDLECLVVEHEGGRADRHARGGGGLLSWRGARRGLWGVVGLALMGACQTATLPEPVPPPRTVRYPVELLRHSKVEDGLRSWCADSTRPAHMVCVDGLVDTITWPDKAVVCVDAFRPDLCVRLGDLRAWVALYQHRTFAQ